MKRVMKLMIALVFGLGLVKSVQAATSDSLTVTIQPNVFYDVSIATTDADLNLGQVALGASTQTVSPATVTINSTYLNTDLTLAGVINNTGAGLDWQFDADTTSQESDFLAAWATFTSTTLASAPAQGGDVFEGTTPGAGSDVITTTARYVGTSATHGADIFELESTADAIDMDGLAKNDQAHLWLYFRMPSASTDGDPQAVSIILTADAID